MAELAVNGGTPVRSTPYPAWPSPDDECVEAVSEVVRGGEWGGFPEPGVNATAFEEAFAAYQGADHGVLMMNGTVTMEVACKALDVGWGDEVIVPALTFAATAYAPMAAGALPVIVDVTPETWCIDPDLVEAAITPRTRAIIPVHLYGQLTDMRPIMALAEKHKFRVIEDACQAIGAREPAGMCTTGGRSAGAIGDYGALSFYPTKNLGAIGDAGAILTNDPALFELARKLRIHGSGHTYYHDIVGGNFRIDALQAAILNIKLRRLEAWTEQRRARAGVYTELLHAAGLTPEHVRPPAEVYGRHVYHQYIIRAQRRDELAEFLKQRKIGAGVYYPLPLHLQTCFAHLGGKPGDFPQAERAAKEVLALPMYPELTDVQQQTVVGAIREFYRG